jgi:alkylated DNA repair protein (DNA oxidative demethylase)
MGLLLKTGYLSRSEQVDLVAEIHKLLLVAPPFTPRMPGTGKLFSVRMTNCGPLGWVSDIAGYRYQKTHPETGQPWPSMPPTVLRVWKELSGYPHPPEACLINIYTSAAKMGLHQDHDEEDFKAPVLSLSLGDTCLFRIGGTKRTDPTRTLRLSSGDALILGGDARLAFHGVDRIIPGSSSLLPEGGRINLTLRRVTLPGQQ